MHLQGQVVILMKMKLCATLLQLQHLRLVLVHQAAQRTGWCCQLLGISPLLDSMSVL